MVGIKLNLGQKVKKIVSENIETYKAKGAPIVERVLKKEIIDAIKSGKSPVKGGGGQTGSGVRFVGYSETYKDQIKKSKKIKKYGKRLRPINLLLSGKMLKSVKSKHRRDGLVSIWFTDKKAKYHNEMGAGKSKVIRRMLPIDNQEFSLTISRKLKKLIERVIKRYTK